MADNRTSAERAVRMFLLRVVKCSDSLEEKPKIAERIKAAELLCKVMGLFEHSGADERGAMLAQELKGMFG